LIARTVPERVHSLVGIAAAPDFTEDSIRAHLTHAQKADLAAQGYFIEPSDYDPAGYPITARLIDEGQSRLVLRAPLPLPFPVRLLHGTADTDVDVSVALMAHADSPDMRLTLVKDADHRFSSPACLNLIGQAVAEVLA
jgi:pimeloyl-ACP methyl ester carboxylesterase